MTRLLLSLIVVAFFVLCVAGMRLGWRNRLRRQAHLPALPSPPDVDALGAPLLPPATGVYVGTTSAGDWQDRILAGGLGHRAAAEVGLYGGGLLLERAGADPLWIDADSLVDARAERALAGKVTGVDGLLVFRWRLGGHEVDSGVRCDDRNSYREWITAVRALAGHGAAPAGAQRGEES